MTITIPPITLTGLVENLLDDCAALSEPKSAFALANVLEQLRIAAKCRAAGIGHRLDGNISMAADEERLSGLHLVLAEAVETKES